ncbi:MAG TPA: GntR family transcriptional regulator [Solirubrobacteraceae bacterium]|jgi:DNA-binding GntR family transcriptional regulator|nr:GntR family transcriptional regulator [Solirubrobacteraceae bacterium]
MGALGSIGSTEKTGRSESLVDGAERALRHWLASGRFRTGDRLPPEHEVATMLGVSRGTLRSALLRLDQSGEIVRRQGSGTFVGHTALPVALDERLERLEPYSSMAARRGLDLRSKDVRIERHPAGAQVGSALGLAAIAQVITISRTLLAGDDPVAVMFDVVHPSIRLPDQRTLRDALENGRMVLDLLLDAEVPVAYARTRVSPALLNPQDREGKLLNIRSTVAALELEELIYAGRDERVAYSRDLFAPDGLDVMVMRTLESTRPSPVVDLRNSRSRSRTRRR